MTRLPLNRIIISSLLLILFLVVGFYIYNNIEKYTVKERLPEPYEARKNPYLAAEYYLKKHHQIVTTNNNINLFKTLPITKQTVLLLGKRDQLTDLENQQILNWVKQGGNLIVESNRTQNSTQQNTYQADNLLNPLGIKVIKAKTSNQTIGLTKLYIENEKQPIKLDLPRYIALIDKQDRASFWAESDDAMKRLLQFPYGKGNITVLPSATIWNNYSIKRYDHAWLLSYLTAGQAVTIIYTPVVYTKEHPSFLLAIIKHYPYTLMALALFIILLLWYKGTRSGPLELLGERNRRQLPEQLTAQANFLYKQVGQQQLISILQQEIIFLVKKHLPHFEDMTPQQQYELLSKLTNQSFDYINQLMKPVTTTLNLSQSEFTQTVIALQAIRNAL